MARPSSKLLTKGLNFISNLSFIILCDGIQLKMCENKSGQEETGVPNTSERNVEGIVRSLEETDGAFSRCFNATKLKVEKFEHFMVELF
jgi:hypothetical protein